jgi:glycerol transport system ATP-binding protein
LKNRRLDRHAIKTRVAEVADLLGLTKDLSRRARNLTAEAKQRVSLGRGLVRADVAAILFDEPLTVIDPSLKWQLRSKLKAVHRALDLLMIYVTHDQVEALTFADEVVVMKDGSVLQVATPARLFEQPEHTFVGYFIGSPGMNLIAAEVDGHVAHVAGQAIELGARYPKLAAGSTVLGFRPDYTFLVPDGGVPVQIRRMEDLGRRRLARVALGPHEIFATVPHDVPIDGEQAHLAIRQDRLFVYVNDELVPGDRR